MYWRVRKNDPQQMLRQYGVYIALVVSLLANAVLLLTRPKPTVGADLKANFDQFARTVATQLLDSSYITYGPNTIALMSGELSPDLVAKMRQRGDLPRSKEEQAATERGLSAKREIYAVRIDSVDLGDPNDKGFMPADVKGAVAHYSADESGPNEQTFHFRFLIGQNAQTQAPAIVDIQELQ